MRTYNIMVAVLACYLISCSSSAELPTDSNPLGIAKPVVYKVSGGRIEIKPRLKYELIISLHVISKLMVKVLTPGLSM